MKGKRKNDINLEDNGGDEKVRKGERSEKQWIDENVREGKRMEKCKY